MQASMSAAEAGMRRFSIAKMMLLVAVLALNLGVIRLALPEAGVGNARRLLLTGLLPIADALLFL